MVDFLRQVCCDDDELKQDINQFLFGAHHLVLGLVHTVSPPGRSGIVLLLTPPNGNEKCVSEKTAKLFLEKFWELFLEQFRSLFDAVCIGLSSCTDLIRNGVLG